MEYDLRLRYNKLSLKSQFLCKEIKKIEIEMKVILRKLNVNVKKEKRHSLIYLPYNINVYDIKYLLSIPDDVFQQHILQYLTLQDIGQLDRAIVNHNIRCQYFYKISNSIILKHSFIQNTESFLLLVWLNKRKLYLKHMEFNNVDIPNSNLSQICQVFQFCENLTFKNINEVDSSMLRLIISNCIQLKILTLRTSEDITILHDAVMPLIDDFSQYCKTLQSLDLSRHKNITDASLLSIITNCTELKSLKLSELSIITDTSITAIAQHCLKLNHFEINSLNRIKDESIILLSQNCIGLKSLHLNCSLTDISIISISKHCTRLESLELCNCQQITDEAILQLSQHCKELIALFLGSYVLGTSDINDNSNALITDKSIVSISKHCIELQSLRLCCFTNITDVSIISISQYCTGLQSLDLNYCNQVTDASIISIAQHCKELQSIELTCCDNITDASIVSLAQHCTKLNDISILDCEHISEMLQSIEYYSLEELLDDIDILI